MASILAYNRVRNHKIMYIPDNHCHKNGHERKANSRDLVYFSPRIDGIHYHNRKEMEPSFKLWIGIVSAFSLPAWLIGVIQNYDNWKGDLLFFLALVFTGLRIYYYKVQKDQAVAREELEQEMMRRRNGEIDWDINDER